MNLPYQGEYKPSPNKKFQEVIVFVHHFGGNKNTTKRHQDLVLSLGFDCVTFNLYENSDVKDITLIERITRIGTHLHQGRKSYVTTWMHELDRVLNHIEGNKILFSLSSPSTSVVGCLGHLKRHDIKAWICDGGPFVDIWQCFENYAALETKTKSAVVATLHTTLGFLFFGGLGYNRRMQDWVKSFPENFPILSLRAVHDRLVPTAAIEGFFRLNPKLQPEVVILPNSDHLEGVKKDQDFYKFKVSEFLEKYATLLPSKA